MHRATGAINVALMLAKHGSGAHENLPEDVPLVERNAAVDAAVWIHDFTFADQKGREP